ncbi:MAG: hypothetical protein AB8H12_12815 [Lewinella sp.]
MHEENREEKGSSNKWCLPAFQNFYGVAETQEKYLLILTVVQVFVDARLGIRVVKKYVEKTGVGDALSDEFYREAVTPTPIRSK